MSGPTLAPAPVSGFHGDVPVTRHFSPVKRKTAPKSPVAELAESVSESFRSGRFEQSHSFCDWVSIYQTHPRLSDDLPRVNDGAFVRYAADGSHECTTLKKFKVEGSHETGVFIRCDGKTVWFEGNVSRFGRLDNVFGFSLQQCIDRINAICSSLGLPPFTSGSSYRSQTNDRLCFTGARITRLDLTNNFQAGSPENAYSFMRHLSMQQASRLKTGTYGEGETVDFGRGSRRVYSKAYLKAPEILRHSRKKSKGGETEFSRPFNPYINQLAEWCASIGLVRFETTYKSTFLIDNSFQYLGGLDMRRLEKDFIERQSVFTRTTCEADQLSELPKASLAVYRMWQAGDDLITKFKKSQFYKHRSALLPFGVDIAIKSNVINFVPRVKVIQLSPCPVPDFYQLPQSSLIRLAA